MSHEPLGIHSTVLCQYLGLEHADPMCGIGEHKGIAAINSSSFLEKAYMQYYSRLFQYLDRRAAHAGTYAVVDVRAATYTRLHEATGLHLQTPIAVENSRTQPGGWNSLQCKTGS